MTLTLNQLREEGQERVIFECVAGSRAYGTQLPGSDEDLRGVFVVPAADYLSLDRAPPQLSDERQNTVLYSLRRCVELLAEANPNILELLYSPEDCVKQSSPWMEQLVRGRRLFITRQCGDTHIGYAMSQIKKARGQNKWVNNPQAQEAPGKEAFCFVIPKDRLALSESPPCRPVPLGATGWDLGQHHAARLEHVPDTYRLYHYGPSARGVFRGDLLVSESIPEVDEGPRFAGLLVFNEQAWRQALADHQNYWNWRRNRNDARWQQQEEGQLDYDAKNMMHTVRLLISGRSILEHGEPIVRFEGENLQLLLDVRAGKLEFPRIMEIANGLLAECEGLKDTATLPLQCDRAAADRLLIDITRAWEARAI